MKQGEVTMLPSELAISDEGYICPLLVPSIVIEDHPIDRVVRVRDPLREKCGGGQRRIIERLTMDARRRLNFMARNYSEGMRLFITLTMPGDERLVVRDGAMLKRILHGWLKWYVRAYPGTRYLWFLEFQKRGAPHVHIFTDVVNDSQYIACILRRRCVNAWIDYQKKYNNDAWEKFFYDDWDGMEEAESDHRKHGCHVEIIRLPHMVAAYCSKESSKMIQKKVPKKFINVGRFWGHSRNFKKVNPKKYYMPMKDDGALMAGLDVMAEVEERRQDAWLKVGIKCGKRDPKVFKGSRIPGDAGRDLPGREFLPMDA